MLFHLPLRQAAGFVTSLFRLMEVELRIPHDSTWSRRGQCIRLPRLQARGEGPIHLIVDSTGLKVCGAREWNAFKYKGNRGRSWVKLHLGVDEEGYIVAQQVTDKDAHDGATCPKLMDQVGVPIERFTGDGMYELRAIYEALKEAGTPEIEVVIPPKSGSVESGSEDRLWSQRDAAVRKILESGRRSWERESGYRQQGRVENTFFRYKQIFGGRLRARNPESQKRETLIGCHL